MGLFTVEKLLLIMRAKGEGDFIPEQKEKDINDTIQRFLDSRVGLKQLTHIANYSFKLTFVSEDGCKESMEKARLLNFVPL